MIRDRNLYCRLILTVCQGISDPIYIVTYYIKWVTTSWTDGTLVPTLMFSFSLDLDFG